MTCSVKKSLQRPVQKPLKTKNHAIETADVALMDDDLGNIARFIRLSRTTHRVLALNIVLALGIKAVFMALAIAGSDTLWTAVFADMGASLLVVANGLRVLRA